MTSSASSPKAYLTDTGTSDREALAQCFECSLSTSNASPCCVGYCIHKPRSIDCRKWTYIEHRPSFKDTKWTTLILTTRLSVLDSAAIILIVLSKYVARLFDQGPHLSLQVVAKDSRHHLSELKLPLKSVLTTSNGSPKRLETTKKKKKKKTPSSTRHCSLLLSLPL